MYTREYYASILSYLYSILSDLINNQAKARRVVVYVQHWFFIDILHSSVVVLVVVVLLSRHDMIKKCNTEVHLLLKSSEVLVASQKLW
jgi:hypothetical protein